jgi:Lamin Tail Domain
MFFASESYRCRLCPFVLCFVVAACSPAHEDPNLALAGQVEFALTNTIDGTSYELRDAVFEISGGEPVTLSSEDVEPTAPLVRELPAGDYSVLLAPGWRLVEPGSEGALDATLISDNPLPFTVVAGETTPLQFRFSLVEASAPGAPSGQVEVSIDVVKQQARALIFSELMSNPAALADTAGEWLELSNVGNEPVALSGCKLLRDGKGHTFASDLVVEPGQIVTLANGETPGFTPSLVYSGVTLPNSAVFVLELQCQGVALDQLTVDPSTWPGGNGVAASLSGAVNSAGGNDDPAVWCDATASYGSDLGTPGAPNPNCP